MHFCQHFSSLQTLRMLQVRDVTGAAWLTSLTNLDQLELTCYHQSPLTSEEQSELGSALVALSKLKSLTLAHAAPGPVAEALSQLTGLTELRLTAQGRSIEPGRLFLPSVRILEVADNAFGMISAKHLAYIDAPQLQKLETSPIRVVTEGVGLLSMACRGVLRVHTDLELMCHKDVMWDNAADVMTVLSRDWQPSTHAMQPICGSAELADSRESKLRLRGWRCSRQCLAQVPQHVTGLTLE
jgi:hypothetical protein